MSAMTEVGDRIRATMPQGMTQRQLAERAGMTADALSRALNGHRGLSPTEIALVADTLGADTHWLITGAPDPFAIFVAARHAWNPSLRERHNPGEEDDQPLLDQVIDLYRAAFPQGPGRSVELPDHPAAMREALGPAFVRNFAHNVEQRLGVDVLRIPGLATDYSLRIGGRAVIVLATRASWFRSNWSLAHELGHLALNHHSSAQSSQRTKRDERSADAFAANLLISPEDIDRVHAAETEAELARMVWDLGVSTEALRNRSSAVQADAKVDVAIALQKSTPRLLRDNIAAFQDLGEGMEYVTAREQAASARRFSLNLLAALQIQTELGAVSPTHLAWALDVPVDDIDFPEPDESYENYNRMLADKPTAGHWLSLVAGVTPTPCQIASRTGSTSPPD